MTEQKKRRRRGERPDGRIQVTYTDGRNPDGTPHRISFYGATRAEAEARRDAYKNRGTAGLAESEGLTVSEWVERWAGIYDINRAMYGPYIDRLLNDLGRVQLASVVEADLIRSLRDGFGGRSSSGATKYRMILQQAFKKARVNRLITWDPAEDLALPKTAAPVGHRALERSEIDLILANWQECRAGLWAMIMLLAGLRRGELIALDWDAVDLDTRVLTVRQTAVVTGNRTAIEERAKTAAGLRSVPICAPLHAAFSSTPPLLRSGPVCKSTTGKRLTLCAFNRGWETFCTSLARIQAGLPADQRGHRSDISGTLPEPLPIRPHDLRHTFCTLLYDGGVDVKSASYLMGHSDSRVTLEIYTHLSQETRTRSASALIGALDGFGLRNGIKK